MKSQHLSWRINKQKDGKRKDSMYMKSIFKVICIMATVWTMMFVAVTTQAQSPPFVLLNDPAPETSTSIHTGNGQVNQVVHPDVLYFPCGWGDVDGVSYKYWMGVTGYESGYEKLEQPCILVSNSISDDTWKEPADNDQNTNPIPGWSWPVDSLGHFSDIDIIYNDDTDEIWAYFRNKDRDEGERWERIELYKTADGVYWELVSEHVLDAPDGGYLLSPTVVKEGNDWWMWIVDASTSDPSRLLLYHSTDGVNFTLEHDCGYDFRTSSIRMPWHIDVVKYDGEYWGFLVETGEGVAYNLCLIKSQDGKSWSGYESPILDIDAGSWDDLGIYRTSFVIENGFLDAIYTAVGSDNSWYAGYTSHPAIGGKGFSSNVIPDTTPPGISISLSPDTLWPPNHKMVLVTPNITATDNCDSNPVVELTSITTNEGEETNTYDPNYDNITGDGHTTNDIQIENDHIYLRAERQGTGAGRIYTITYTATDASGNTTSSSATVTVPHSQ